jgi:putative hydrolase of the HAD superfamily
MIKAVAFDLGNTLTTSPFPLNWQNSYRNAIIEIMRSIGFEINDDRISKAEGILLKYNTRVNPREYEVNSDVVFSELFINWGVSDSSLMKIAKDTFAAFFLGQSELYFDSIPVLKELKKRDIKIGILTNVAYGMDKEYFTKDVTAIGEYVDVFLTSVEVGFRKPNPRGYHELASRLDVNLSNCVFIGDEEADIIGANVSGMMSVLIDRNGYNHQFGQVHTVRSLDDILGLI